MATSGSYDYSLTATNVITEALEIIGVLAVGQTIDANDQTTCLRSLNMMVKQWSGNFDFAPGLKAFSRKRGFVFLQSGQGSYSLGPSGDNASLAYIHTTLSTDEALGSTSLSLTSTTGMAASDNIGIVLNDGSIHWTTISGTPGAPTTIATGLASAASSGNVVFTYTTKLIRPLYIEEAVLLDTDGNDISLDPMTLQQYENIATKYADGQPGYYYYENSLTNGTLYLDYEPSDVTQVLRITFMAPAEDYDAVANDIAYPQEWYLAIAYGLAKMITPKFQSPWTDLMESNYQTALMTARSSYAENTDMFFQPGVD